MIHVIGYVLFSHAVHSLVYQRLMISLYVTCKFLSSEGLEGRADLAEAKFYGVQLGPVRTVKYVAEAQLLHLLCGLRTFVHR